MEVKLSEQLRRVRSLVGNAGLSARKREGLLDALTDAIADAYSIEEDLYPPLMKAREHVNRQTEVAKTAFQQRNDARDEAQRVTDVLREVLRGQRMLGHTIVPLDPPDELLTAMAIRFDHGLGVPGYYDDNPVTGEASEITHQERMEMIKRQMRQLYEEATGQGFYTPQDHSLDGDNL